MTSAKPIRHANQLEVVLAGDRVGRLGQSSRGSLLFEYDSQWIARGFPLSPMPLFEFRTGAFAAKNNDLNGLHGVFNDALPDGWGLMLVNRALQEEAGWLPTEITALDRLSYIGARAMGALEFKPSLEIDSSGEELSIAKLAEAAVMIDEGSTGEILRALQIQGGSPGGARPKVTVALSRDGAHCLSGFTAIPSDYAHWIVKFRARNVDPDCMGRIERTYANMAQDAGIEMPETKLIEANVLGERQDYFAVRRFDRVANDKKHIVSLGGMLDASHRIPNLDYEMLLRAVSYITRDVRQVQIAFRMMVFNVLAHNRDDHIKNFSFMHDGTAESDWRLTPAYDLTFSTGMNNQHMTSVMGSGIPSLEHVRRIAEKYQIGNWENIVAEVLEAVSAWPRYASIRGVENAIIQEYEQALQAVPARVDLA